MPGTVTVASVAPVVVGVNEFGDLAVEVFALLFEQSDDLVDQPDGQFVADAFQAVVLHDQHLDDLSSSGDAVVENGLIFRLFFGPAQPGDSSELGQRAGVDGVGLGEPSQRPGEVAGLTRIDQADRQSGRTEFGGDEPTISPGGFQDDTGRIHRPQARDQIGNAARRVVDGKRLFAVTKNGDVQARLGNVDANENRLGWSKTHGGVPSSQMRAGSRRQDAAAHAAVRAYSTRPAASKLSHGVNSAQVQTLCGRPRGRPVLATLRTGRPRVCYFTL